jgi:hypothetical protein
MKKLFLLGVVLLLSTGCKTKGGVTNASSSFDLMRWHDDSLNVTCWTYKVGFAGALACIPDKDLGK